MPTDLSQYAIILKTGETVEKIKDILFILKEKVIDLYYLVKYKFGIKKFAVLIIAVVLLLKTVTAIALNISVLGKDGIKESKKAEELIHIELSEKKYIDWMKKTSRKAEIKSDAKNMLKAETINNYSSSHSYVIISHPYAKTPYDMASFAYHFYDMGFYVYLPYLRGFGESDFKTVSMGYEDSSDILKWIDEIVGKDKKAKIYIFGLGLGGTASLLTANKALPENVKGIISDSAYADVGELFKYNIKELYSLPSFPIVQISSFFNKIARGWSFKDIDVKSAVEKSKVPVFYIQGGEDQVVPAEQIDYLYDVTTVENSDYLYISGATHCENADFDPEKYWNGVDLFILNTMDL